MQPRKGSKATTGGAAPIRAPKRLLSTPDCSRHETPKPRRPSYHPTFLNCARPISIRLSIRTRGELRLPATVETHGHFCDIPVETPKPSLLLRSTTHHRRCALSQPPPWRSHDIIQTREWPNANLLAGRAHLQVPLASDSSSSHTTTTSKTPTTPRRRNTAKEPVRIRRSTGSVPRDATARNARTVGEVEAHTPPPPPVRHRTVTATRSLHSVRTGVHGVKGHPQPNDRLPRAPSPQVPTTLATPLQEGWPASP